MTGNASELMNLLPVRTGHFCLESGYHAQAWFELDQLFFDSRNAAELARQMADRIAGYEPDIVWGALTGGAFLGVLVANLMHCRFVYTARQEAQDRTRSFSVRYQLPASQVASVNGQRIAFVDDAISTGSATRGSIAALRDAGAEVVIAGAIVQFGRVGVDYLKQHNIPVETLVEHQYQTWHADECPQCRLGVALEEVTD